MTISFTSLQKSYKKIHPSNTFVSETKREIAAFAHNNKIEENKKKSAFRLSFWFGASLLAAVVLYVFSSSSSKAKQIWFPAKNMVEQIPTALEKIQNLFFQKPGVDIQTLQKDEEKENQNEATASNNIREATESPKTNSKKPNESDFENANQQGERVLGKTKEEDKKVRDLENEASASGKRENENKNSSKSK